MKSIVERSKDIWEFIRKSPIKIPTRAAIPDDHVDRGTTLASPFQRDAHYFQVRINEMYLPDSRRWFSAIDPMVFIVSEFTYDKKEEAVPFVVGPMMMEKYGQKMPTGMIFSDTRVAGLHPYRGGRLSLAVVLFQLERDHYVKKLLQVVESAANALDFSSALSTYLKVGSIVLEGVEALLGLEGTKPLVGVRKEFDPDAGDLLKPSYFALINMPESELNTNELWVRNNQLLYGKSLADANPFRQADYVLYSIVQTPERGDETTLPFYPLWQRVVQEATVAKDENWENAKANMATLYQMMALSPDLTLQQTNQLADKYISTMKTLHEQAKKIGRLGPEEEAEPSELDAARSKAVSILKM